MQMHDRIETSIKRAPVRRVSGETGKERSIPDPQHHLVTLQRSIGNAQVARMLAQREEVPEEEIRAKHDSGVVQAAPEVGLEGGPISDALSSRINAKRGGGSPLDSSVQARMEDAFGASFADVRVHTDSEADSLNRSVSAKAFTTGSDIFFSSSASPNDSSLLAHELTHVVQQRGAPASSGSLTVGPAGDSHEAAADSVAAAVASGGAVASAQREVDEAMADISRQELPEDEEEMPV